MDTNAFEVILTPYAKLAQANVDLLQSLPRASETLSRASENVKDSVAQPHANPVSAFTTDIYASFWLHVMKNWVDFWGDMSNSMTSVVGQNLQSLLEQHQDSSDDGAQAADAHGKSRRTRAAA